MGQRSYKAKGPLVSPGVWGAIWVVDASLTNKSRHLPLAVMGFILRVTRGIEVHELPHLGRDTYGSHGEVPYADEALETRVRLGPVDTVDGKLRFLDPLPFSSVFYFLSKIGVD